MISLYVCLMTDYNELQVIRHKIALFIMLSCTGKRIFYESDTNAQEE